MRAMLRNISLFQENDFSTQEVSFASLAKKVQMTWLKSSAISGNCYTETLINKDVTKIKDSSEYHAQDSFRCH